MAMAGGYGMLPSKCMKGIAVSPPTVTVWVRVPPSSAVAPMVTSRTAPDHFSFRISVLVSGPIQGSSGLISTRFTSSIAGVGRISGSTGGASAGGASTACGAEGAAGICKSLVSTPPSSDSAAIRARRRISTARSALSIGSLPSDGGATFETGG